MPVPHSLVGHRDRLKAVVRSGGLWSLPDYQQVEFLLFYGIPYKDVQPLAKELIARYGSLKKICAADPDELKSFKNMTNQAVDLLKAMPTVFEIYAKSDDGPTVVLGPDNIVRYIRGLFATEPNVESLYVLSMTKRQQLLHADKVSGGFENIQTTYRSVVELALRHKAEAVIIAHNHPSNFVEPSLDDLRSTRILKDLLQSLGIVLSDHIVVASDRAYSMLLKMDLNEDDYAYQLDNIERYLRQKNLSSLSPKD